MEQQSDQPPSPIDELAQALTLIPGVGAKVARRAALHIAQMRPESASELAEAIENARHSCVTCARCRNLADSDPCEICRDPNRHDDTICVVEQTRDLMAIERSRTYQGRYHVLHGTLSPANGVSPEDIEIPSLIQRVHEEQPSCVEVIVATNPSPEGDATADFIRRRLAAQCPAVTVTRIARGIPTGAELGYTDRNTLMAAISQRTPVK